MSTTTINTTNKSLFNIFKRFFKSQIIHFVPSIEPNNYSITLFDLTTTQTNNLLNKFTSHFHLTPQQPNSVGLAA